MRLIIRELFHKGTYGIWIRHDRIINGVKEKRVAKPVELEFVDCHSFELPQPTFEIDPEHIDSLIRSGTQEFEMSGLGKRISNTHAAEMGAVKYHLEDMRKLVFEVRK